MHVNNALRSAPFVQVVNVLSYHRHRTTQLSLQARQGLMRGIGRCACALSPSHIVEIVNKRRISTKPFGRRYVLDPMTGPKTIFGPKRSQTAFCAYPSAG